MATKRGSNLVPQSRERMVELSQKGLQVRREVSDRKKDAFLVALAETGNMTKSAKAAGFKTTGWIRELRKVDKDFSRRFDEAMEAGLDCLESEAVRRASEGTQKAVYHQGEVVGYEKIYSDALLQFLLRGNRPEKYRDTHSSVHVTGAIGVAVLPMTMQNSDDWDKRAANAHPEGAVTDADFRVVDEQERI